jgi:hypothetical protein
VQAGVSERTVIQTVWSLLATDSLSVFSDLEDLIDEVQSYSRVVDEAGEPTAEIEAKEPIQRLDAARYLVPWLQVHSRQWVPPPVLPPRVPITPGAVPRLSLSRARQLGLFGLRKRKAGPAPARAIRTRNPTRCPIRPHDDLLVVYTVEPPPPAALVVNGHGSSPAVNGPVSYRLPLPAVGCGVRAGSHSGK